jgi:hypothetical protein
MQDVSLLVLGSIFTFGALIVYYFGRKRDNNNAVLWSLFTLFHGLHEFFDYYSELTDIVFYIRVEVMLAIISSLVLLAVCIEFLGQEHKRFGKLIALIISVLFGYLLFLSPDQVFIELYSIELIFELFNIKTSYFQFIYGILLIFISLIAIEYNLFILKQENKRTGSESNFTDKIMLATFISMTLFIIFEGFTSTATPGSLAEEIFTIMEAVFAFLFLVIPVMFMALSKPGINSMIAFNQDDGRFLMAYDFNKNKLITVSDENIDAWINTASFLSALSAFSKTDSSLGGFLSSINSERGVFILTREQKFSIALNTRTTTKNLKNSLTSFMQKAKKDIEESFTNLIEVKINPAIVDLIQDEFRKYK